MSSGDKTPWILIILPLRPMKQCEKTVLLKFIVEETPVTSRLATKKMLTQDVFGLDYTVSLR